MASAQTSEFLGKTVALPETLRQTTGPGSHETACPICYDAFEPDTLTIEHIGCGRRFGDDCLQIWLRSASKYPKCPVCRDPLVPPDIRDLPAPQRAQAPLSERRKLPTPSTFVVNWNSLIIMEAFKRNKPDMNEKEVLEALGEAASLSMDAVMTLGLHKDLQVVPTREIVGQLGESNFSPDDIDELWTVARLFGFSNRILHRSNQVLDIGVWLPIPPWVEVVQDQIQLQQFFGHDLPRAHIRKGYGELLQVPIPTSYLERYLGSARQGPHPSEIVDLGLKKIAKKSGATHWGVLDFRAVDHGPEIILMPWPNDRILDGFRHAGFPGW